MGRFKIRDFGKCLFFGGGNSKVDMGQVSNLGLTGNHAFTLTLFVNPSTFVNDSSLISYGGGGNGVISLSFNGITGQLKSTHYSNDHNYNLILLKNFWQHLGITYDGTTETLYLNGVAIETWNPAALELKAGDFYAIGDSSYNGGVCVGNCYIDEPGLWNACLTPQEMADIYFKGNYPTANLQGLYRFTEGLGSTAADSSPNGNTGTITNATWSTNVFMKPRTLIS